MRSIHNHLPRIAAVLITLVIGLAAVSAFGQNKAEYKHTDSGFCGDNNWSSDSNVSFKELREMTVAAGGTISVDGGQNGGIGVRGEDRSDVAIRACVQAWGKTEEAAKASVAGVKIGTGGTIKAEGSDDKNWSVSYMLLVPRSSNLNLSAHNGGISISGVDGNAEFETMNGGVNLSDVAGSFRGHTTNGGINITLAGASWRGNGLDVTTTNGGVHITMPENYAAHIETGTVNGGYSSDIPALKITTENIVGAEWTDRTRAKRVVTNINGGGAPIKVLTTNGGVHISTTEGKSKY